MWESPLRSWGLTVCLGLGLRVRTTDVSRGGAEWQWQTRAEIVGGVRGVVERRRRGAVALAGVPRWTGSGSNWAGLRATVVMICPMMMDDVTVGRVDGFNRFTVGWVGPVRFRNS